MAKPLEITYEQMRSLVVESLRNGTTSQISDLELTVADTARRHGLAADVPNGKYMGDGRHRDMLEYADRGRVNSIVWDLIIEGVIRPGLADGINENLPHFHITEWGKMALERGTEAPYDPDNYLARLKRDVPEIDSVILTYLNESLHTFRIGCLLSSTITLGCASEKALLLLIQACVDWLPPGERRSKYKKATDGKMIKTQFTELRKLIEDMRSHFPPRLADAIEIPLTGIFEFLRTQRNNAGHPTGKRVEREVAYANLAVFPSYLRTVYEVMDWMSKSPRD